MREKCRVSRGVVEIGPSISTHSIMVSGVHAHAPLSECSLVFGLESSDVFIVLDEIGDLVVARGVCSLERNVTAKATWIVP
jgi:hypothetical protein